jgi:hypothetical protein
MSSFALATSLFLGIVGIPTETKPADLDRFPSREVAERAVKALIDCRVRASHALRNDETLSKAERAEIDERLHEVGKREVIWWFLAQAHRRSSADRSRVLSKIREQIGPVAWWWGIMPKVLEWQGRKQS